MTVSTATYRVTRLSVGQLLDRSFWLYRRHFIKYLGITAVVQVLAVSVSVGPLLLGPDAIILAFPASLLSGVLTYITLAALTYAVVGDMFGRPTSFSEAYRYVGQNIADFVAIIALIMAIFIGTLVWWFVPIVGWLTGFGMLMFLGLAVSPLVIIIYIVEEHTLTGSIRRAWELARQRFWWLIGLGLLLTLLNLVVVAGPVQIITLGLQTVIGFESQLPVFGQLFTQTLLTVLYVPLQTIVYLLAYLNVRIYVEGLDLSLQAQRSSGTDDPFAALAQAPQNDLQKIISGREIGYFALLTVGFFGFFMIMGVGIGFFLAAIIGF